MKLGNKWTVDSGGGVEHDLGEQPCCFLPELRMEDISGRLVLFSGSVSYTEEGPRLPVIRWIWMLIVSRARTPRYYDDHIIYYITC